MNYKLLKRTRVIISLLFVIATFSIFLDIYETFPNPVINAITWLQFTPSLLDFIQVATLASSGFIIVLIITFLMGRIYCSTICPLGIMQDVFAYIAKRRSKKKFFYKKKKPQTLLRFSILALTIISILTSFSVIVTLLDPYSNAGRFFTYLIRPVLILGNNALALVLQHWEIYTLHPVKLIMAPWFVFMLVTSFFLIIAYLSYKRGRLLCNTICPVGTLLGLLSKISWLKINFDSDKCTKCGHCIGVCKSECIDVKQLKIDHSRCVDCFNCLSICQESALSLGRINKNSVTNKASSATDHSRRNILATGIALITSQTVLADIKKKNTTTDDLIVNKKDFAVAPPGAIGIKRFNEICTGCGLCVTACPTQVLQPAVSEYGLKGFMQPHMDYGSGYCNFDCRGCTAICPTGALLPISIEEKQITQLGKAVFVKENCIVYTDGTDCGACSEHCPTKAVNMIPYEGNLLIPEVNQDICIGCGACEHPCPVNEPYKAIYVNGNAIHQAAQKPKEEESIGKPVEEDFPF